MGTCLLLIKASKTGATEQNSSLRPHTDLTSLLQGFLVLTYLLGCY